jgi:hypothetical protein
MRFPELKNPATLSFPRIAEMSMGAIAEMRRKTKRRQL